MALPNPLPDNPMKWDGWKNYNSPNLYLRLCLDFSSNANTEIIEDNCRQLLIWWQKKLPLKNQPSNPIAQILRQGLDEAPHFLAEARTKLLNPEERREIDKVLHVEVVAKAMEEFKKLFAFILADKTIDEETEAKLFIAGERLGLSRDEMLPALDAELQKSAILRVKSAPAPPPPPEPPPVPVPIAPPVLETPVPQQAAVENPAPQWQAAPVPHYQERDAKDEFRRILRMSRLCLDGEDMSDSQRDAMCNMGESLGLSGGDAEDLIDEYLEDAAAGLLDAPPPPRQGAAVPVRPQVPVRPTAAAPANTPPRSTVTRPTGPNTIPPRPAVAAPTPSVVAGQRKPAKVVNLSPAARAAERQKFPNFVNGLGMEMFLVPSGRFEMGSIISPAHENEQPVTPVTLSCFHMSRFPVTNAQYEKFDPSHRNKRAPWADDKHPVVYVSWKEADDFCRWLRGKEGKIYRLPLETEWEYAARGEDGRLYPWGDKLSAPNLANFADSRSNFVWRDPSIDDGYPESSPVGMFPRGSSPFGIEELSGNVFEWCLDCYEPYKGRELVNPPAGKFGANRVFRGGSWKSRAASLRATARGSNAPTSFANDVGFRIVCECE